MEQWSTASLYFCLWSFMGDFKMSGGKKNQFIFSPPIPHAFVHAVKHWLSLGNLHTHWRWLVWRSSASDYAAAAAGLLQHCRMSALCSIILLPASALGGNKVSAETIGQQWRAFARQNRDHVVCSYWCAKTGPLGDYILQTLAIVETTNINRWRVVHLRNRTLKVNSILIT